MKKLFPPVVTGPVIVVIGIGLSSTAIKDALGDASFAGTMTMNHFKNILIALFTLAIVVICTISQKDFSR